MKIEKASINDIETIQQLAAAIWPVAYNEILKTEQLDYMLQKFYSVDALKDQMLTKGHQFYLLKNDSLKALGFASVSQENEQTFKLQKLYVLPQEQGKNIGKKLLQATINFTLDHGGKKIVLNVNRYNKARFFYEKIGFKMIDEVDIDIGNNYFMNDFVMELNL